jgi:hypothetical protein
VQLTTTAAEAAETADQDNLSQLYVPIVAKKILFLSNQEAIGQYFVATVLEKVKENKIFLNF